MRVFATLHKNNKIIKSTMGESELADIPSALLACLEPIYKELDISEPIWVTKHARDLSRFGRTKFLPSDFVEPVNFDFFEIETLLDK